MPFSTYSGLRAAVADWLVRTDLTTQIIDFVALAEARINRDLRVREMVSQASDTVSTQTLAVPSDFIEVLRFTLDTASDLPLEYRPVEDSEQRVAGVSSGQPRWFSIVGSSFRFYPAPDGEYTYTLDYYAKVPALASTSSNWLLAKAPDLYLAASLVEGFGFLMEPDNQAAWDVRYQRSLAALHAAEARSKRTSGPHRMRVVA